MLARSQARPAPGRPLRGSPPKPEPDRPLHRHRPARERGPPQGQRRRPRRTAAPRRARRSRKPARPADLSPASGDRLLHFTRGRFGDRRIRDVGRRPRRRLLLFALGGIRDRASLARPGIAGRVFSVVRGFFRDRRICDVGRVRRGWTLLLASGGIGGGRSLGSRSIHGNPVGRLFVFARGRLDDWRIARRQRGCGAGFDRDLSRRQAASLDLEALVSKRPKDRGERLPRAPGQRRHLAADDKCGAGQRSGVGRRQIDERGPDHIRKALDDVDPNGAFAARTEPGDAISVLRNEGSTGSDVRPDDARGSSVLAVSSPAASGNRRLHN